MIIIGVGKPVPIPDSECSEEYKLKNMEKKFVSSQVMTLRPKKDVKPLQFYYSLFGMQRMHNSCVGYNNF